MSSRLAGAILALTAAALLALSLVTSAWWAGHPVVDGRTIELKTVNVGLHGGEGCNTGGDGACTTLEMPGAFVGTGYGALAVAGGLAVTALLLGILTLRGSESRKVLGKVVIALAVLAAVVAIALIVQGPKMSGSARQITIPVGYGMIVFWIGSALGIAGAVLSMRPLPKPTLRPSRGAFAPGLAAPPQPADMMALLPPADHRAIAPPAGAGLAGPAGPLGVASGSHAPMQAQMYGASPALRPLYDADPNVGGTGGYVGQAPAPLPTRSPTPMPVANVAEMFGAPAPMGPPPTASPFAPPPTASPFAPAASPFAPPPTASPFAPAPMGPPPTASPFAPPPTASPFAPAASPFAPPPAPAPSIPPALAHAPFAPSPPASRATSMGAAVAMPPPKIPTIPPPMPGKVPTIPPPNRTRAQSVPPPPGAIAARLKASSIPPPIRPGAVPTSPRTLAGAVVPPPPASFQLPTAMESDTGDLGETLDRDAMQKTLQHAKEPDVQIGRPATNSDLGESTDASLALPEAESTDVRAPLDTEEAPLVAPPVDDAETNAIEKQTIDDTGAQEKAEPEPVAAVASSPPAVAVEAAPKIPISTAPDSLPPPTEKQAATSGPSPACPQCEAPMAWVEEHLRFYCKSCRMYF